MMVRTFRSGTTLGRGQPARSLLPYSPRLLLVLSLAAIALQCMVIAAPAAWSIPAAGPGAAGHGGPPRIAPGIGLRQVPFIENVGQIDRAVKYYAPVPGGTVFVTGIGELVYSLASLEAGRPSAGCAVTARLLDAARPDPGARHRSPLRVSDFRSADPRRWQRDLPAWGTVDMGEVYPGIGLELRAAGGNVEQVFHVQPGGRPGQIRVGLRGASGLRTDSAGRLEVLTRAGTLRFTRPVAYQVVKDDTVLVEVAYATGGDGYGFSVGPYDPTRLLTIDPLLAATYLGGTGEDGYRDTPVVLEPEGTVLVAGSTRSSDFPTAAGAYDATYNSGCDVFLARFDSQLSTLLAATFFGGSGDDGAWPGVDMVEDSLGRVYVTGATTSTALATTPGAYDRTYNGAGDVFVAKFSHGLDSLLACTYLGGSAAEDAQLVLGGSNDLFLVGTTASSNFPTTPGAFDRTRGGASDAFVARLDRDLTTLLASTYLGGTYDEFGTGVLWDPGGYLYVTGLTNTAGFPTTAGAYDRWVNVNLGEVDVFVSKFTPGLSTLVASTFIGGTNTDFPYALALGTTGDIFVTGHVQSPDYPTTPSAFDRTYNSAPGDSDDVFVSRLSPDLSQLVASTFLGGNGFDWAITMTCDGRGHVYVGGETRSFNLPTTSGAFSGTMQSAPPEWEGFISRFDEALTTLEASTYLGGGGSDLVSHIVVDPAGNVLASGGTGSFAFSRTAAGYDTTFGGGANRWGGDVFVVRLDSLLTGPDPLAAVDDPERPPSVLPLQVSPNPVRATATIRFALTRRGEVTLAIHDVRGRRVSTLAGGRREPGIHTQVWNGRDDAGRELSPGVYFLRVTAGDWSAVSRLVVMR